MVAELAVSATAIAADAFRVRKDRVVTVRPAHGVARKAPAWPCVRPKPTQRRVLQYRYGPANHLNHRLARISLKNGRLHMITREAAASSFAIAFLCAGQLQAQWTLTVLTPDGAEAAEVIGVRGGQQVGYARY